MTIKEMYEWALQHNCEDSDLVIRYPWEDEDIILEIANLYNDASVNKVDVELC